MLKRRPRLAATRNLRRRTSTLWALEEGKVNDSKQVQRRQFNRWLVSASLIPMAGKVLALEALRPKARVAVVGAGHCG